MHQEFLSAGGAQPLTAEVRAQILLTPCQVMLYDLISLFAGKLHAVLCRKWKNRIKGRDFYDFVWYVEALAIRHLGQKEFRFEFLNSCEE